MSDNLREQLWGPRMVCDGLARFRLWAPKQENVSLRIGSDDIPMCAQDDGWFEVDIPCADDSIDYRFILGDGTALADPASRSQPEGLAGHSRFRAKKYDWETDSWKGRDWVEAVIYELHIGTFTPEGTFSAAAEKLDHLADLGFTAIEIMPVAQFPGTRGWGYDGVLHFAPQHSYGSPETLKAFIDHAHSLGMMVFLDVVYNHFGPEGNYLNEYAPDFFHQDKKTPWGAAINYEIAPVRAYFIENVIYWLEEFRFDGLRFDAVDHIVDESEHHLLTEIAEAVKQRFPDRKVHLVTENPNNSTDLLSLQQDGKRLYDGDWNDTFHHAIHAAVTGETDGHYSDFKKEPWQQIRTILASGYLEIGDALTNQKNSPKAQLATTCFIHFLQNHDQIGNRAIGDRLTRLVSRDVNRSLTQLLLLAPQIPLMFMGDDHDSNRPFLFFSHYDGALADIIRENRPKEAENFGGIPGDNPMAVIPDPNDNLTFEKSRLVWDDRHSETAQQWMKDLKEVLDVRQTHIVPLLKKGAGYSSTVLPAPDGCVFIDWVLPGGKLAIRANFTSTPVDADMKPSNQIFPVMPNDGSVVGAYSVRAFVSAN